MPKSPYKKRLAAGHKYIVLGPCCQGESTKSMMHARARARQRYSPSLFPKRFEPNLVGYVASEEASVVMTDQGAMITPHRLSPIADNEPPCPDCFLRGIDL